VIYWHLCAAAPAATTHDFLSAGERQTLARMRFPKRREEWLLGRWTAKELLRLSMGAYRGVPLPAISVCNDPDGAPYLSVEGEGRLATSLSISHRAGRAFCALSPVVSPAIGADIERVEPRAMAFVEDFFTAGEADRVRACVHTVRDTLVTVIWSAKESVLKALHHGLRVDTRTVEIRHVAGLDAPGTEGGAAQSPPDVALQRAGLSAGGLAWQEVEVVSGVPGALRIAAWWRPEGDSVLTLAVVWP
jgi:4'-phosphopantetheinyl transferase